MSEAEREAIQGYLAAKGINELLYQLLENICVSKPDNPHQAHARPAALPGTRGTVSRARCARARASRGADCVPLRSLLSTTSPRTTPRLSASGAAWHRTLRRRRRRRRRRRKRCRRCSRGRWSPSSRVRRAGAWLSPPSPCLPPKSGSSIRRRRAPAAIALLAPSRGTATARCAGVRQVAGEPIDAAGRAAQELPLQER